MFVMSLLDLACSKLLSSNCKICPILYLQKIKRLVKFMPTIYLKKRIIQNVPAYCLNMTLLCVSVYNICKNCKSLANCLVYNNYLCNTFCPQCGESMLNFKNANTGKRMCKIYNYYLKEQIFTVSYANNY